MTSRRTRAVITQGDSYYAKGAYEEALRAYQEGLARNPENSVLQARIKRTREAVAFRKSQIDTLTSQGDSDYARGAYDEAIGAYQKGLSLDPGNTELQGKIQRARKKQVDALTRRGDSYYEDGQYNQAIGQYQKALDIDPNNQALAERKTRARNARDWEQAHGPMKPGSLVAHPKN